VGRCVRPCVCVRVPAWVHVRARVQNLRLGYVARCMLYALRCRDALRENVGFAQVPCGPPATRHENYVVIREIHLTWEDCARAAAWEGKGKGERLRGVCRCKHAACAIEGVLCEST
jgi:hypothetical protein